MSGLKDLCDLVSGLSFLHTDTPSSLQPPAPDRRAVRPPAGFRRHSTGPVLPAGAPCWAEDPRHRRRHRVPPGLSRCLSHGDSLEEEQEEAPRGLAGPGPGVQQPSARYKTELCRPFQESGLCRYGDKCQFAHGLGELRIVSRHPKYKTELCRTFHSSGFCPYGSRCHFIHHPAEERPSRPRLQQSTSFSGFPTTTTTSSTSPGPELPDWDSLRAAVSHEFARVMGLSCCCSSRAGACPKAWASTSSTSQHRSPELTLTLTPGSGSFRSPYPDSLSDNEEFSSSGGSSGSESPVFDHQARRLPIFSRISVSED
ncbi:mRNA decay activator protein ZFP36L1-like [Hemiscyllium ocellatum]|uniref:mRNA decay activator protein ZFP36L1-like n=1 Tax=Hemiscyllium ocellatum TaxID=170820 RepID=UPI0029663D7E|nr:mRNA decay activator protein ZFP36L1-like [Hemiscyllium ocellatum]